MSIIHWDEVEKKHRAAGDISGTWSFLGNAAGTVDVGVRRIAIDPGKRSTAVHVHGAEEEIFFVLAGSGLLWNGGSSVEVRANDAIVHLAAAEAHTLRADPGGMDVLAFGMRCDVEICYLPRAQHAWAGPTVVAAPGLENLWKLDDAAGPLEFPPPGPRPANVTAVAAVAAERIEKGRSRLEMRGLGKTAGAKRTGLNHVTLPPGASGWPPHCHSAQEEIFVVLDGEGTCRLGDEEHAVRRGHVVSRPAGTGIAHSFKAGPSGLVYLAYGTRVPNDIAYFPRSRKVYLRGIGVIGRIEPADYWDGETD